MFPSASSHPAAATPHRVQVDHVRLEKEIALAARVQSRFQPPNTALEHGSHIWGISRPAAQVGGDIYDWIALPDGSWIVYVADISDKGVPAALFMSALWFRIRSEVQRSTDITAVLKALNTVFFPVMAPEGFFATIIISRYQPRSGCLTLVSGGHPPALHFSGTDGTIRPMPQSKNVALGLQPDSRYTATEFTLPAGDSILLYTDGVTEAMNPSRCFFGTQGVAINSQTRVGPPWSRGLMDAIGKWCAPNAPQDDLTLVELWRDPRNGHRPPGPQDLHES
jgi:sigma-B regulation protein RsbU (phosphoserine phosphatase)